MLMRVAAQSIPQDSAPVAPRKPASVEPLVWNLPGFSTGARVMTSFGLVPVQALRRNDPVKTHCGKFVDVKHVDEIKLDRRFLLTHPEAQPVFLPRGCLGASSPNQNMLVSPAQKIRSPGRFDKSAGQPSEEFIGRGGVARKTHGYFTYYVFHCGGPYTVNVDGVWVDLDPGTLKSELH